MLVLILALLVPSLGRLMAASPAGEVPLRTLAADSDLIVRGLVRGSKAEWVGRTIFTFYEVQTLESLKGAAPAIVRVAIPGGEVGPIGLAVSGAPVLTRNREYFFFTGRTSFRNALIPIALPDGVVPIHHDAEGSRQMVFVGGRSKSLVELRRELSHLENEKK